MSAREEEVKKEGDRFQRGTTLSRSIDEVGQRLSQYARLGLLQLGGEMKQKVERAGSHIAN